MKPMLAAVAIVLLAGSPALAHYWGYAPVVVAPAPMVAYYAPPPPMAYYGPAPVVTYYGPAPVYAYPPGMVVARPRFVAAPVWVPAPVMVRPRFFVPGEPVRNVLRAAF